MRVNLGRSLRRRRNARWFGRASDDANDAGKGRDSRGGHRHLRRALLIGAGVVALGFGGGYLYATQVVFPVAREDDSAFIQVPDLRGMDSQRAQTILAERGLAPGAVDSISHPAIPRGEVIGQTPLPGQLAVPSAEVGLTLSLGPERRPIPDVTRLRADQGLTLLEATGFEVQVDSVEAQMPEGRIIGTFPAPGVVLPLPSIVQVSVSRGPPMVLMPALAGMQEEEARVILDSLGLEVGDVETRFRFGFNQGEVLEHFPPADSLIPAGTRVRLVIGNRGFFDDG